MTLTRHEAFHRLSAVSSLSCTSRSSSTRTRTMAQNASTSALVGQRPGETPDEAMARIVAEYQRNAHGNSVVQPMHQNPMAWDARADTASGLRTTGRSAASMPTAGSAPRPLAADGRIRPGTPLTSSDNKETHVHPVSGLRTTDSECRADSALLSPPLRRPRPYHGRRGGNSSWACASSWTCASPWT